MDSRNAAGAGAGAGQATQWLLASVPAHSTLAISVRRRALATRVASLRLRAAVQAVEFHAGPWLGHLEALGESLLRSVSVGTGGAAHGGAVSNNRSKLFSARCTFELGSSPRADLARSRACLLLREF